VRIEEYSNKSQKLFADAGFDCEEENIGRKLWNYLMINFTILFP